MFGGRKHRQRMGATSVVFLSKAVARSIVAWWSKHGKRPPPPPQKWGNVRRDDLAPTPTLLLIKPVCLRARPLPCSAECVGDGCTTCSEWAECEFGYGLDADTADDACDPFNIREPAGCFSRCCSCECAR